MRAPAANPFQTRSVLTPSPTHPHTNQQVDRENAQVGKYVAKAGAKAAVGKLHMRGMKPATPAPVAPKAAPAAAH